MEKKKSNQHHHPKRGDKIKVEPIRGIDDIKSIAKLLTDTPRDHLLFTMGINNGLRAGDLLKLKVKDVSGMKMGGTLTITESKTGKENILVVNKPVHKSLKNYLDRVKPKGGDYLFLSRKGNKSITIQAVNNMIKKWARAINLDGNHGAYTLRKTWGYMQRTKYGVGFEIICKRFNHSSPAVTMRYLGIEDKEVHSTLMNEIG